MWLPTFENDLQNVSTGTITTTLLVVKNNLDDYFHERKYIGILKQDDTWSLVEIDSVVSVSDTILQLNLVETLNIDSSNIKHISLLMNARLDTDKVQIKYIGGVVAESTVQVIESDLQ